MNIKPISYMKYNAAKLRDELNYEPMHVTQNGNASLVIQTHEVFTERQERIERMELMLASL